MISYESAKMVTDKTSGISELYPIEATYNSRCSLWTKAYKDGKVNDEEFGMARIYYGRLWNYVGD